MAITISDAEAISRIGEVMRQVAETREPVIVEWDGKPQVAVVPAEPTGPEQTQMSLERWLEEADRVRERIRLELGGRQLPDIDELIDGGRDERDDPVIADLYRR
jgi:prevent-host-death family protein